VPDLRECKLYYEDSPNFLVQYRGNFLEEMNNISYACGDIITNNIGVVSTGEENIDKLLSDVSSIVYIDHRCMFVLQDISPSNVDSINSIKINPYLNLTGRGVLIGMIDTGIDYLNEEFIREDDTSRIVNIWDQTIQNGTNQSLYIGETYTNEQVNNAIKVYRNKEDPYKIVPLKDEIDHGTRIAGIIGAKGYSNEFQGVANDSDFVVVKLLESINFKNRLKDNGVKYSPVYNNSEVLAAIEYLKNFAIKTEKPMVIYIGVGATEGSHDGNNLISKYLTNIGSVRGIVSVAGVGNEGEAEGHASGNIKNLGDLSSVDLRVPREIKYFSFNIWVRKPNVASLRVISPTGDASDIISSKSNKTEIIKFIFLDTEMTVRYYNPEYFTGHEFISIVFKNIKAGIWIFQLIGDYITNGRYDIWLPPKKTLPEGTKFMESDSSITLTMPSEARKVVTVAYYGNNNALSASSGKGFNSNNLINPDVATIGANVLTTKVGGGITTYSGSSVATGIIAGACALLLQWGIVEKNDITIYSTKMRSYLIYGADRSNSIFKFPNTEIGYGNFDLLGVFSVLTRNYRLHMSRKNNFIEYYINRLFIRIPK
jgi:subtilisin family serine protease